MDDDDDDLGSPPPSPGDGDDDNIGCGAGVRRQRSPTSVVCLSDEEEGNEEVMALEDAEPEGCATQDTAFYEKAEGEGDNAEDCTMMVPLVEPATEADALIAEDAAEDSLRILEEFDGQAKDSLEPVADGCQAAEEEAVLPATPKAKPRKEQQFISSPQRKFNALSDKLRKLKELQAERCRVCYLEIFIQIRGPGCCCYKRGFELFGSWL